MRIGYFADGPWSHRAYEKISKDPKFNIAFICLRKGSSDSHLKEICVRDGLPCLLDRSVNSRSFIEELKTYKCDILVSMSFDQIFKQEILNVTPEGIVNCHAGKLPFYRGRNVLNWVLINDEKEFGITAHFVDKGIDTGDIITQRTFKIDDTDNYSTLLNRSYSGCAEILYESLLKINNGSAKRIKQSELHPVGMYCGKRKYGDEIIDWSQTSRELFNFVRAICPPGPGALTFTGDGTKVKIDKLDEIKDAPVYIGTPGQVLAKKGQDIYVKTKDSFVKVVNCECTKTIKVGDRFNAKYFDYS